MLLIFATILVLINIYLFNFITKLQVKRILRLFFVLINFVYLAGYLIKIFTFYFLFQSLGVFSILNPDFKNFTYNDYYLASLDTILFYIIFILYVFIIHFVTKKKNAENQKLFFSTSLFQDKLFFYIILVGFFFKILQFKLGIGKMGAENISLPFMLDSLIFRFQSFAVFPAFAYFFAKFKLNNIKLNLTFLFYTSFSIIFGSRSGLFFFLLMGLFLILLLNIRIKFKAKYILYIILFVPIAFYFYFTGSYLRGVNMNKQDSVEVLELLKMINSSEAWSVFFESVTNRFIGLDGLMYTHNVPIKYNLFSSSNYVNFFTKEVVGIKQDFDFRSPGFLASIKFLNPLNFNGSYFLFFTFLLTLSSLIVNFFLSRFSIIFQFLFMYIVYGQLSEGYVYFEDFITLILVYFFFSIICLKSFQYKLKS
jgi:hypothetical protein